MSQWFLLAFVLAIWVLWLIACVAQAAVSDALRGVPDDQRRGVSVLPGYPLFPLALWGAALLINRLMDPWGTLIIGGAHIVLGGMWGVSIYRDRKRLASIEGAA